VRSAESAGQIAIADQTVIADPIATVDRIASAAVGAVLLWRVVRLPVVAVAAAIDQNSNSAEKPAKGMNGSPVV
jgi:hypothetical protein